MSISGLFQPVTMLRIMRPLEMWSITAPCFAATMGWLIEQCEVATTPAALVEAAIPEAQV